MSAHFPVASANHCPNEGKDCWVSLGIGNTRGGKGEIIGAKVGASLGFPFHFLSPKSEATASWSSWEPKVVSAGHSAPKVPVQIARGHWSPLA